MTDPTNGPGSGDLADRVPEVRTGPRPAFFPMAMQAPDSHARLLAALREQLPELEQLLANVSDKWVAEDLLYRFWHQSFKVYALQEATTRIAIALRAVSGGEALHEWFEQIVSEGTGRAFERSHNDDWTAHTRPIVEAFFHAWFMLEMAVRYARELEEAPSLLPSGWAALLELYRIR